ncbi:MAG: hypothetical protein ACT4QF_17725 [Sporichthyaceae bacterium]
MNVRTALRRPTVIAAITVGAVALGFGGQAAADAFITGADVKNNSLSGADIKNGTVSGSDIKNGSVTGRDIKTNTVTWEDIANNTIRSTEIRNGSIELKDMSDKALNQLVAGILSVLEEIEVFDTLDSLEAADVALAADIKKAQDDLTALAARVAAAEGNLDDVIADAARIEADLQTLATRVDALETKVEGLEDAQLVTTNWGNILRNVLGSATTQLRNGPYAANFGLDAAPPMGTGSLEINVVGQIPGTDGNTASKAAFGNEVDFVGADPATLGAPSFWVYTTKENADRGANNLPNIAVELNPDLPSRTYTTLNFVPTKAASPGDWTEFLATDGFWYFTGATGADTNCEAADQCTLDEAVAALGENAAVYSVGVSKGRDLEFHGAVDALTIGTKVYDFEARGVIERTVS